ncbi:TPA: hypothetical protein KE043_003703 [Citrobacter koseri]|nr:hypothetical protein [Citrobacter koseri]
MERKFMIYQRRDGFQIAEESTGTRLENGMEFLARPNKSVNWCIADFNIFIDDDYDLVGEEVIDCSRYPSRVLCFVDGVMKTIDFCEYAINAELTDEQALAYFSQQSYDHLSAAEKAMANTRDHAEALMMNEERNYNDAISDFTWELQEEDVGAFFAAMDEALRMNATLYPCNHKMVKQYQDVKVSDLQCIYEIQGEETVCDADKQQALINSATYKWLIADAAKYRAAL